MPSEPEEADSTYYSGLTKIRTMAWINKNQDNGMESDGHTKV
ncbi:hypothetical protein [Neisseria meningitidis]|nr:hypothetical protein [Neisseria meningitidis]